MDSSTETQFRYGAALLRLFSTLGNLDSVRWNKEVFDSIQDVTAGWDYQLILALDRYVLTTEVEYLTTAKLFTIAAEIASPRPTVDEVYAEIMHKAAQGVYQRQDPERPAIRLAGAPAMSCEFVRRILLRLRRWEDICSGEANMDGGLFKQVKEAHESVSKDWNRAVISLLGAPEEDRHRSFYFAPYTPWQIEEMEYQIGSHRPRLRMIGPDPVPMPEPVRLIRQSMIERSKDGRTTLSEKTE